MSARIAIGVGCRRGCPADAIEALVRQALVHLPNAARPGLFTIRDKSGEPGLLEAADRLGLELIFLSRGTLREQAPSVTMRSDHAEALFGVPSVAEAAALAGAGAQSVLLVTRMTGQGATCAVAGSRP